MDAPTKVNIGFSIAFLILFSFIGFMIHAIIQDGREARAIRHTVVQYSVTGETLARWEQVYVRYETNGRCSFRTADGRNITITQPYMTVQEVSSEKP